SGEYLIFRVMHLDFFGIPPHDIARFSTNIAKQNKEGIVYWRDKIKDKQFLLKCGLEDGRSILAFSDFIEMMIGSYINYSVPAFIEKTINRSGLLRCILREQSTQQLGVQGNSIEPLFTFVDFVKKEA